IYARPLETLAKLDVKVNQEEFVEYLLSYVKNFTSELFQELLKHLLQSSHNARNAIRHDIGLLDRAKVLSLLDKFYRSSSDLAKEIYCNPKKWPIAELDDIDLTEFWGNLEPDDEEDLPEEPPSPERTLSQEALYLNRKLKGILSDEQAARGANGEPAINELEGAEMEQQVSPPEAAAEDVPPTAAPDEAEEPQAEMPEAESQEEPTTEEVERAAGEEDAPEDHPATSLEPLLEGEEAAQEVKSEEAILATPSQVAARVQKILDDVPKSPSVEKDLAPKGTEAEGTDGQEEPEEPRDKAEPGPEEEEAAGQAKPEEKAEQLLVTALFEKWDNECSGFLEMKEVDSVLSTFKEGMEEEALTRAKLQLPFPTWHPSGMVKLMQKDFQTYVELVMSELTGSEQETLDNLVEFLMMAVGRPHLEQLRGNARRKWLLRIEHAARGDILLRYVASTEDDAPYVLNQILFMDMPGVSFAAALDDRPIHVPRVHLHGNIHFWNSDCPRSEQRGSFLVLPLEDVRRRVFGVLGLDTLRDKNEKTIFVPHEIRYYQVGIQARIGGGGQRCGCTAYHHIRTQQSLLQIILTGVEWLCSRAPGLQSITAYFMEPGESRMHDYTLRKVLASDLKGECIDCALVVTQHINGEQHIAVPLRNTNGQAIMMLDFNLGPRQQLSPCAHKDLQKMVKMAQAATHEILKEDSGDLEPYYVLEENVLCSPFSSDPADLLLSFAFLQKLDGELIENICYFDPTASYVEVRPEEELMGWDSDIPEEPSRFGSAPLEYLYNWTCTCLSLIEMSKKLQHHNSMSSSASALWTPTLSLSIRSSQISSLRSASVL
ncbi:hypothetical protein Chor_005787, partial [Crotalus horridus]